MAKLFIHVSILICVLCLYSCSVTRFVGYYASAGSDNSGDLKGRVFQTDDTTYKVGTLPDSWERKKIEGGDLAFVNKKFDGTITVNSTCNEKKKNYSLRALSESLLIGIQGKEALERQETMVDSQKALKTLYTGSLNNVPIMIETVVVRKGICIYDFTYASSPEHFEIGVQDFDNFVSQFKAL